MGLNILLSDGVNKNALAVLRAIGNKYNVDVLTYRSKYLTLSAYSKYIHKIFNVNKFNEEKYWHEILDLLTNNNYDVFLPVGLKTYLVASKHRNELLKYTNALIPRWESMKIAYNKDITMKFTRDLGIPTPKTIVLDDKLSHILDFPVVIKSSDESGAYVKYCNNEDELKKNFENLRKKSKTKIIIQEYIKGFGTGFYGVCVNGEIYAMFMHRRIKEFPITGGPSAVAESYYSNKLKEYGIKICKKLKWTGPLMAEFKYSREKEDYYLIELNPKLWGSLDLTIKAGVNIPDIIIKLVMNETIEPVTNYRKIIFRWVFPDEFKVLMSGGESLGEFFKKNKITYTNLDFSDPLPTIFQIIHGMIDGFIVAINKNKRYPHGVVRV